MVGTEGPLCHTVLLGCASAIGFNRRRTDPTPPVGLAGHAGRMAAWGNGTDGATRWQHAGGQLERLETYRKRVLREGSREGQRATPRGGLSTCPAVQWLCGALLRQPSRL